MVLIINFSLYVFRKVQYQENAFSNFSVAIRSFSCVFFVQFFMFEFFEGKERETDFA